MGSSTANAVALALNLCEGVWSETRKKIITSIKKVRQKHQSVKGEGEGMSDTIAIPERFPETRGDRRVLTFLDPSNSRPYAIHGVGPSDAPGMLPRELPCPELEPANISEKGKEPSDHDIAQAYERLNQTNPIRTCLGAPPKQLSSLFNALNAPPKVGQAIWAKLIAPHLMTAVRASLTAQAKECAPSECTIAGCTRCAEGGTVEPKRKRRKLNAGISNACTHRRVKLATRPMGSRAPSGDSVMPGMTPRGVAKTEI